MGLSVTASHVIWFFAFLGLVGGGVAAFFQIHDALDSSRAARDAMDRARLHTRITNASFCYDSSAQSVVLQADNSGDVPLDISNVSFILNGSYSSGWVAADAAGDAGSIWAPGESWNFTKTSVAVDPLNVVLATQQGVQVRATKLDCPRLASILVTPASSSLLVGSQQDYAAQGLDQFGRAFAVPSFSWGSSTGSIASLTSSTARLTAGTASGAFTVSASYGGLTGHADVTLTPDAPASVSVSPSLVGVAAGGAQAFSATARDQYGNVNSTATLAWSTNAGSISSGGALTAQTTAQSGRSVTATTNGVQGSATVDVYAAAPAAIVVSPATPTINTTHGTAFTAAVTDAYGNANATASVAWSATRGAITSGGAYTAPSTVGSDTVTATSGAASGNTTVSVIRTVHVTLFQSYNAGAATTTFARGDTVETRLTVVDQDGLAVSGATVKIDMTNPVPSVVCCTQTTTNAGGFASFNYTIPNPAVNKGSWTDALVTLSGTGLVRDTAADVTVTKTLTVN